MTNKEMFTQLVKRIPNAGMVVTDSIVSYPLRIYCKLGRCRYIDIGQFTCNENIAGEIVGKTWALRFAHQLVFGKQPHDPQIVYHNRPKSRIC